MRWYDWVTLAIVVAGTVIQIVRGQRAGFGLPLFEAAGVVLASLAATRLSTWLSNMIRVNTGVVLLVVLLVFAFVALVFARWLFALAGWSFPSHDAAYSIIFGLAMGWAAAHMFLRVIVESEGPRGDLAKHMATAPVAREVYQFRTWNSLRQLLFTTRREPAFE